MSRPSIIEKIKSITLVVLFLSTVLLLCFFWGNVSLSDFTPAKIEADSAAPVTKNLIKPARIIVNFGEENYTVLTSASSDVWLNDKGEGGLLKEIGIFGETENILVKEITENQFKEVFSYRSIYAEFNYNLPTADFCRAFEINKPQSYDVIEGIKSIGYSELSPDSLFIHDDKNQKYYWLISESDKSDIKSLINDIENSSHFIYYPVSTYLGVLNETLIPLNLQSNLSELDFKQDMYSYQTEKISIMAESFFGKNFDFVRRITEDDGTIIYMYGYGKNVLIASDEGTFEYKCDHTEKSKDLGVLEAMEKAVSFVSDHGSWESLEGARMQPYLIDIESNPNKEKGYRFTFGMEINGTKLVYKNDPPITIDVMRGQVTYYKRNMIDFKEAEALAMQENDMREVFSSINLIAQNYGYIYDCLTSDGELTSVTTEEEKFNLVAETIESMDIGFVKGEAGDNNNKIVPAWIIKIENKEIYFNLYTAEPIGFCVK